MAAVVTAANATTAIVTVPVGAITSKVSVTTTGGTVTSSINFTVVPKPTITSFSPASGSVGSTVVITGTGLTNATTVKPTVKFGTLAAVVTAATATTATVTVPVGAVTGKISVTTTGGTVTSAANYTVVGKPTIAAFSPASGVVGAVITISGTNLTNATTTKPTVLFGTKAAIVSSATATTAVVLVPAGAVTGKITVTTTGGTVLSVANFTVIGAASEGPNETPQPSSLVLSAAGARAAAGTVTLTFSGPLDTDSATDTAHCAVTVNGAAATIESAAYTRGTLTLSLANGALQVGDKVVVAWNGLLDAQARVLNGQSGTIPAR